MNAIQTEVSDGTLVVINVGLEYFKQSDISVYLDQNTTSPLVLGTDYEWLNATQISFIDGALPVNTLVTLVRHTQNDEMLNIFDGGAPFNRAALDENYEQLLRLSQEFSEGLGLTGLRQPLDMHDNKIINLQDGTDPTDAVNLSQLTAAIAKTLRTPEDIPLLPEAASRANRLLGFDNLGNPVLAAPVDGSASALAMLLASTAGAAQVGTANGQTVQARIDTLASQYATVLPQVQSVSELRARTAGGDVYLVDYNGGWQERGRSAAPGLNYQFDSSSAGWSATNATLAIAGGSLVLTSTAADPQLVSPVISINGSLYTRVRMKVKRTAGNPATDWDGKVFYGTTGHALSSSYIKSLPNPNIAVGQSMILEWDMTTLTLGGNDWITSTVNRLRIDLGTLSGGAFEIDWINVSAPVPASPRGNGRLFWDAASTEVDNGVTVFKATAIELGRWKRDLGEEGWITPDMGGAIGDSTGVGDGTDDSLAIQRSITVAENTTGAWFLPPRKYRTTSNMIQRKQLVARGCGPKTSMIYCDGTTAWTFNPLTPSFITECEWSSFGLVAGAGYGLHVQLSAAIIGPPLQVCAVADSLTSRMFCSGPLAGIFWDNSVANTDGIFTSTIIFCEVVNGIRSSHIGDSNRWVWNKVYGANCSMLWDGVAGARGSQIMGNNLTCTGGAVALLTAEGVEVCWNQCEHPGYMSSYTGIFDSAMYVHSCYMINIHDNVINPDNRLVGSPYTIANSAVAIDGTTNDVTIWGNDIRKGNIFDVNVGEATVSNVDLERQRRFYGSVGVIGDAGTGTILPTRRAQTTVNLPAIANAAALDTTFSVPGAVMGQVVRASADVNLQGLEVSAWMHSAGNCTVRLYNRTGAPITLGTTTLRVTVIS